VAEKERIHGSAGVRGHPARFMRYGEHRLNTIKRSPDAQNENWLNSIARKRSTKTPCSLLSIDSRFPKLHVAARGSGGQRSDRHRHGLVYHKRGKFGIAGNLESASYRTAEPVTSSNPSSNNNRINYLQKKRDP